MTDERPTLTDITTGAADREHGPARPDDLNRLRTRRDAEEGERGGAEVAALVEAVLTDIHATANGVTRAVRAALADPGGALAKHDAEVLRAAADLLDQTGSYGTAPLRLRMEADRIAGDQS